MWMLNLKPLLSSTNPSGSITRGSIDIQKIIWQKLSKKGTYPSARCGVAMVVYKNKAILFGEYLLTYDEPKSIRYKSVIGGVFDEEGPRHSLMSTFHNDMFAFDMERRFDASLCRSLDYCAMIDRRWYQLGMKEVKTKSDVKRVKKGSASAAALLHDDENEEDDEEVDEDDESGEEFVDYQDGKYFGFIDEHGQVVYIDMEVDEMSASVAEQVVLSPDQVIVFDTSETSSEALKESEEVLLKKAKHVVKKAKVEAPAASTAPVTLASLTDRVDPSPRINPCLMLRSQSTVNPTSHRHVFLLMSRGNSLFVYGGVTELGDVEVTLDDCW